MPFWSCFAGKANFHSPYLTSLTIDSLLSPLGQYRRTHVKPSKGKKAAKAQQKRKNLSEDVIETEPSPPPPPELARHVDIGLNAITKKLASRCAATRASEKTSKSTPEDDVASPASGQGHAVIFVARGDQSSAFNCHFPKMVAAASQGTGEQEKIRLVGFSRPTMDRLSKCIGIPRVSSIGIARDAPGAKGLFDMVKEAVKPVEAPWLEKGSGPAYLPTKINAIETTIGPKRQKAA